MNSFKEIVGNNNVISALKETLKNNNTLHAYIICSGDAITRTDYIAPGHKLASFTIDTSKCVKCGACVAGCKFDAISKK